MSGRPGFSDERLNIEGPMGTPRQAVRESGIVQSKTEVENGSARVPLVGATWVGCTWTEGHIGHRYLVNVVGRILCCTKTSGGCCLPCEQIEKCSSSTLSGIAGPENSIDLDNVFRFELRLRRQG